MDKYFLKIDQLEYISETDTYKEVMYQKYCFDEIRIDNIVAPILQNKAFLNKFTGSLHYITIANTVPYFAPNTNNIKQIH